MKKVYFYIIYIIYIIFIISHVFAFNLPITCASHSMNFDCTKGVEMSKPLNLKIGDVIAYGISPKLRLLLPLNYPASHIVHRIVNITVVKENSCKRNICFERQTKYYTTKGDNNQYNDPYPVPSFAVVWLAKDKIDP